MNASSKNSIFAIASIVGISLIASYILFHYLASTGIFKNQYVEFGGAAAFFLVIFYGLKNWYLQLADKAKELEDKANEIPPLLVFSPTSYCLSWLESYWNSELKY
jgi:hypothetical protein